MIAQTILLPEINWTEHVTRKTCGVYKLMLGVVIQYIGKSKDVDSRIGEHRKLGRIPFVSVEVVELPESELADVERALIEKHQPPFNMVHTDKMQFRSKNPHQIKKLRTTVYLTPRSIELGRIMAASQQRAFSPWLDIVIERLWAEASQNKP